LLFWYAILALGQCIKPARSEPAKAGSNSAVCLIFPVNPHVRHLPGRTRSRNDKQAAAYNKKARLYRPGDQILEF